MNLDPTSASSTALVRLRGAEKSYRSAGSLVAAVRGVDLDVHAGEMVALVGPSGCGKSTLLHLISGVERADKGTVHVAGIDLTDASEARLVELRRAAVGIVFQAFHLVPTLTVAQNVALPLALAGRRDAARVATLLEKVGMSERATHFPNQLSGGEQQRTAVARALVHRPRLIVADEPTGNLDSTNGERVFALLDRLRAEEGVALVLATHDERLAARATRIERMRDGVFETERA